MSMAQNALMKLQDKAKALAASGNVKNKLLKAAEGAEEAATAVIVGGVYGVASSEIEDMPRLIDAVPNDTAVAIVSTAATFFTRGRISRGLAKLSAASSALAAYKMREDSKSGKAGGGE